MPKTVTFTIQGIAPLSQSRPFPKEMHAGESEDDYRARTWRQCLHTDQNGEVFIPPDAIKNCVSEAATFLSIKIPGSGKATYTKHVVAGVSCIKPVMLGVKADTVTSETLLLPSDGRRGSGRRVWKTYPILYQWGGEVELLILDETVLQTSVRLADKVVLEEVLYAAGQYIGLHRFRPRNNGRYGRFMVSDFQVTELALAA